MEERTPYDCWSDFSLVSDEKCLQALYAYPIRLLGERPYDAVVVSDDHAQMWNVDSAYLVGLKNGLPAGGSGQALLAARQPFWVDSYGNVHLLADDLLTEKGTASENCLMADSADSDDDNLDGDQGAHSSNHDDATLFAENERERQLRDRFRRNRTIRVLLARNVDEALDRQPHARLLLVDQFETFISARGGTIDSGGRRSSVPSPGGDNLDFVFTGAPRPGRLSVNQTDTFYELCREQQTRLHTRLRRTTAHATAASNHNYNNSRNAYLAWRGYTADIDSLPDRYTDIRTTKLLRLFEDSTNVLFWRNLTASILQMHSPEEADASNSTAPTSAALVIRVSFERRALDAPAPRDACLLRLKRFLAFLCKLYAVISKLALRRVPDVYWTTDNDDRCTLAEMHDALTREYVIGLRERLLAYDRYLHMELVARRHGQLDLIRHPSRSLLIRSNCPVRRTAPSAELSDSSPDVTATRGKSGDDRYSAYDEPSANNVVAGVVYSTLVSTTFLPSALCRLGASPFFLVRASGNPLLYKLRTLEC